MYILVKGVPQTFKMEILICYALHLALAVCTVDVKKRLQNHSQNIISIVVHQIREHDLVTSVEDYNVLMLTSCRFVYRLSCKWLEII